MIVIIFIVLILVIVFKINSSKIKGSVGEFKVNTRLNFLGNEYISLNDILIKSSNGNTSQIDELVLSEYGIFIIETKNYKGWIFGNEKSENWTQVIFKEKHTFRNPIKQNWSHVYALKNVLSEFPNIHYFPIVVFTGDATLKGIESTVPVIYSNRLNSTIKNLSSEKCLSQTEVEKIKSILESVEITEKMARKEHVKNIKQNIVEKQLKMENLICPRCNGELKLRNGRNGKFYGCSNYPRCRFTMPY
ncbi:NERD domain-containing protein [Treponema succinifaciens]|uniref:NERD domain protein n=1 Tax=Treponema succinifaciens (strain ATCC 33096 / DSM 2489 / 6091) TaxID=869209 RepID=F2NVB5_TRES6|nr:NERD domain-containing protein [Treponema succinifaciens]AEB13625.1 NERD domain protein [Treponema succinifaciens DSM 2489]